MPTTRLDHTADSPKTLQHLHFIDVVLTTQDNGCMSKYYVTSVVSNYAAKSVALRVFDKLDPSIKNLAFRVNNIKREASNRRHPLAHPVIPDERVRELLREELHDGTPGLHPLEVAAFEHTANTPSNIQARAADSGRR